MKLQNPVLYRRAVLCEAVERELMSVLGVDRYETSSLDCRVKIEYDPRQLRPAQLVEILDGALANVEHPDRLDRLDLDLAICTASLPIAAIAQFAMPALLPATPAERARVRMIEEVMDTHFEAINWGLSEIRWFKRAGKGYQSRMSAVLRSYMEAKRNRGG